MYVKKRVKPKPKRFYYKIHFSNRDLINWIGIGAIWQSRYWQFKFRKHFVSEYLFPLMFPESGCKGHYLVSVYFFLFISKYQYIWTAAKDCFSNFLRFCICNLVLQLSIKEVFCNIYVLAISAIYLYWLPLK